MANREQLLKGLGAALGIGGDYFSAKGGQGTPYGDQLRKQALGKSNNEEAINFLNEKMKISINARSKLAKIEKDEIQSMMEKTTDPGMVKLSNANKWKVMDSGGKKYAQAENGTWYKIVGYDKSGEPLVDEENTLDA